MELILFFWEPSCDAPKTPFGSHVVVLKQVYEAGVCPR